MSEQTHKLQPGTPFPEVRVTTSDGQPVQLGKPQGGASWQLVVIYRGQHCPICSRYLTELATHREALSKIGVDVIAASADSEAQLKAQLTRTDKHHFEGINFPIAYGLSLADMQALGLYISDPRSPEETDHPFAEPGLFVINERGEILIVDISNVPFARPALASLVGGLGFLRNPDNNYPTRGRREYV